MSEKSKKWLKFRISLVGFFCFILFIALVSRAFQLQIISGKSLKALAERQHTKNLVLCSERGNIFDRNGEKLAATIMAESVYIDPSKVRNCSQLAGQLAAILRLKTNDVRKQLSSSGSFRWIARQVSPDQAERVKALHAKGVYLINEPKRFYPHREVACHLLGFSGLDSKGLEGLELKYDEFLRRSSRKIEWMRDAKGKSIYLGDNEKIESDDEHYNLILTIDSKIQYIVESRLKEAVYGTNAKGGNAIVMDPKTGEILAMASIPQFNLNAFSKYPAKVRRNRTITDCFDPGSVFKPFLVAAALEEGAVQETDIIDCENGSYRVADKIIREAHWKKHKNLTIQEILKYSSNIGCVKIAEKLGKEAYYRYIQEFGFGAKTGIDLPGEIPGLLRGVSSWRAVDFATMAFGQGISVTPIQLIVAMSSLANHGVLMKPYLVQGVVDKQGRVVREYKPTAVKRIVSHATAVKVTSMMTSVVEDDDGTGKNARLGHINVAGKTGTSQKFDFSQKTYSNKRVTASFVGFFPAEDPKMVILVTLDEPETKRWGGTAAAPVFKNISEQVLSCYAADINIDETGSVGSNNDVGIVKVVVSDSAVSVPADENVSIVPDFTGKTMREVLRISQGRQLDVTLLGTGWALNQKPAPGTFIGKRTRCTVVFGVPG